jgi:hypothetical protein
MITSMNIPFTPLIFPKNNYTRTEQMEVHHHPDLHHNRKHFREYFLEFLMIFLAVTMGFISENIREHYVEHERAKTGSLRYFTAGISKALTRYEQMNKQLAFGQDLERNHLESSILPVLFSVLNSRYLESLENGPTDIIPIFKRTDPHTLDDLYTVAAYTRSMNTFLLRVYTAQREEAKKDIQLLQTEYPD